MSEYDDENTLVSSKQYSFLKTSFIVFLVLFIIFLIFFRIRNSQLSSDYSELRSTVSNNVGVSGTQGITVTQDSQGNYTVGLGIECADDEIIQWDDVADQWVCASDDIGTNITPPTCFGTDKLVWTGTAYQCATDITGTALIPIQCLVTEKLMWDGSGYICSTDLNTAGITPPTCLPTEKLLWNGATYVCAIDDVGIPTINTDNQTLSILGNNLSIFGGNTVALPTDVYTSNNGITQVGNNFSLGGTLLGNTTINTGGFNLNLTGAGGLGVASGITTLNSVAYQWPNADGGAGEVLATDGAGNLSWATVVGGGIINLNGEAGVIQFFANDSNVTITSAANTHTLGWTGLLPINRGGTNSNAVPTAGSIAYGDGASYQFTAVGAPGEVLTSNGAGAPTWVTDLSNCPGSTTVFCQNGNSFGAGAILGTNDNNSLSFITNGTTKGAFQADGDFEVDTNTFFVNVTTNRVGIGTTTPLSLLDMRENINNDSIARLQNPNAGALATAQFNTINDVSNTGAFGIGSSTYALTGLVNSTFAIDVQGNGLALSSRTGNTRFYTGGPETAATERMRILSTGEVGIGTNAPASILNVAGSGAGGNAGIQWEGVLTAPALSTAGDGRIYFNSTSNQFECSENNGAYFDCFSGAATVTAANNGLTLAATTVQLGGNLIQNTTITNNGFDLIFNGTGNGSNKIATFAGDVDIQGVIDPTAVLFSDSGVGSYDPIANNGYRIGVTGATQRPIYVSPMSNATRTFEVRNSTNTSAIFSVDTLNQRVGVGGVTAPAATFHNNGSTLFTSSVMGNFPAGGVLGLASATVDTYTAFNIAQTTALQTITLPSPTNTTAGREVIVNNTGSTSVTVGSTLIVPGGVGRYTWNGATWSNTNAIATSLPISSLTAAIATNSIDNTNLAQTWDWSNISTQTALSLTNSGSTLTSGSLFSVGTGSTGNFGGTGAVIFNLSGAHTGFGVNVISNTQTGVGLNITANALTSGRALQVSTTSATMAGELVRFANSISGSTGRVLQAESVTTAAVSNGIVRFNFSGAHTGSGFQIDDATATGEAMTLTASGLTSGVGLRVRSTNAAQTGSTLSVDSNTSGATGFGIARFAFTGNHTGAGVRIDDTTNVGATTLLVNTDNQTSGTNTSLSSLSAAATGHILLISSATAANPSNGIVRFNLQGGHGVGNGFQLDDNTAVGTGARMTFSALTTGSGLIVGGTNAAQTGVTLGVNTSSTSNFANGGIRFNFTGNHGGTGFQVDSITTGAQIMAINADSITGGTGLVVSSGTNGLTSDVGRFVLTGNNAANTGNVLNVLSSGANTLAKAINVSVASTGNLATGAVRFNFSGAHTGTGFQVDDATVAGVGMRVNVAALTTGTGFQVLGNAVTSGDLLNVGTNSSGNFTGNGAIDFGAAGSHTGTFFTVRDVANDHDGNVMRIDSSGDIGTVLGIVSNRTTTGTLLSVTTNSLALNSTLGVINVANTGAPTGILARFQSNSTAGSGMTILANGNTGIATVAPAVLFHTGSAAIVSGTTVARFENAGGTCDVTPNIAGGITCTSDERFKTNIQEFTGALDLINQIDVKSYNLINGGTYQVGVIAQGLEQILPDLVRTNEEGYMSVSYSGLTPYLVQAVQEQQVLIDSKSNQEEVDIIVAEVNGEVTNLQGNFAGLQDTLDTFQNQFSELQNDDIAQLQTSIIDLQSYDQSTALQLEELSTKYSDLELEIVQINLTTAGLTLNLNALEGRVAGLESTAFANHTESGKATAIVGEAHIEVLFTVPFITEPIVNLTPLSNMNGILYWVEETSTNGFTIKFSEPIITLEHKFNWSAQ